MAIGALVVAGISLGWQVLTARSQRPLIRVATRPMRVVRRLRDEDPLITNVAIEVTNVGGHATTIVRVRWNSVAQQGLDTFVHPADKGPPLPYRLEAKAVAEWQCEPTNWVIWGHESGAMVVVAPE